MHICKDCIEVSEIQNEIERLNKGNRDCYYCKSTKVVAHVNDIFPLIKNSFFKSVISLEDCSSFEKSMFWEGYSDIEAYEVWDIIQSMELSSEELETDLIEYLSKGIPDDNKLFVLDDGTLECNIYQDKWTGFIESISHGQRFFNFEVQKFLDDLFSIIHVDYIVRDDICTIIQPTESLYRARIANTKYERESIISDPSGQLGPVPETLASDQRMTPSGISAFYASRERETCFSEVRAITGDIVISGKFNVNQPIKLLDLRKLDGLGKVGYHLFDSQCAEKSHKSQFLKQLMFLMSKPASNRKNSNYLETQVIFEYFRVSFGSDISGLMFSSVQTGLDGLNVVFFPENSPVNTFLYRDGQNVSLSEMHYSEDDFYSYTLVESAECKKPKADFKLEFVPGSLELHNIKAVKTIAEKSYISISVEANF